jgi:hypothetical protein
LTNAYLYAKLEGEEINEMNDFSQPPGKGLRKRIKE